MATGIRGPGTCSPGIGRPRNSLRQGTASNRAHDVARLLRALSVEIPVLAYICRYSFDTNTNARRARSDVTHRDRFQMDPML